MARDRKTMTDYLAETELPVDDFWLAHILSEAQESLEDLAQEQGWEPEDEPK